MRLISYKWSRTLPRCGGMHFYRLLISSVSALLLVACGGGGAEAARVDDSQQQVALPQTLCDLLPQADAERIMSKALVQQRNDDSACHYQDARGTTGTSLFVNLNALSVSDQCRLTSGSEPLSGVGDEACIAFGQPAGIYTTVVFMGAGRTFEATAPGDAKASELATAVAKVILSKIASRK